MLEVTGLSVGYAGNDVVHEVALEVAAGEAVAVIGSNGAGKTTLLRGICGLLATSAGDVRFDGDRVGGVGTAQLARRGLAYVPAERHLFPGMSVLENLALGAYPERPAPGVLDEVYDLFPRLAERRDQSAGTMSGGEQQMLAVGRALTGTPRLLLLDEPTTGLAPRLASEAFAALRQLKESGMTILLAEQQVPLALELSDRGYVLEDGRIQLTGTAQELGTDDGVRDAYMGVA